jgi:FtsZ-binding cell division protein ZapB
MPGRRGAAVFFGQTLGDSSVVANQRTVCALDYLPALREAAKRHASFILAPHPYEKFSVAMQLLRELGKGTIVNCNSYALLGHPNVESVITLSSSLGREAEFFGKKTTFLLGDPLRPGGSLVPRDAKLFTLGHTVLTELFWRDVLGLAAPEHAGLISPNLFHAPNLFRSLFGGWAYDQLDPVLRRKNALDKTYIHPQPWKRIEYRQTGLPEEQVIYYHPKQLKLDFRASGNGFLYTSAGFSMAEKFGTWTEGTCAELVVPADLVKPGTTAISFRLQPFVNHEATQQRVKLSVNHIPAGEFGLQAQGEYRVMFTLPASEPPTEYCSICFELPDACSPQALGLSSDSRLLGLRLIEAELVQDANSFNEVIITKVETNISGEMENPLLLENQALKQAQQAVEQENQALKQAQQAVEQENQVLADEVKRIHAGWSWRVTAPLRQGKQVVHRFLTLIFHP